MVCYPDESINVIFVVEFIVQDIQIMQFSKGHTKLGGRKKGTPNKVSSDLRTRIKSFLDNNFEQLEKDISKLQPTERVRFLIKLMEFVVPKQKSMELNAIDKTECIKVVFKGTGVPPITSESEL